MSNEKTVRTCIFFLYNKRQKIEQIVAFMFLIEIEAVEDTVRRPAAERKNNHVSICARGGGGR